VTVLLPLIVWINRVKEFIDWAQAGGRVTLAT
jgi:hypothetical protein